jgi:hypothetical protein
MIDNAGYKSHAIGPQDLMGSAIGADANAADANSAAKVDNDKWYAAILKNRWRLDKLHERLFKD